MSYGHAHEAMKWTPERVAALKRRDEASWAETRASACAVCGAVPGEDCKPGWPDPNWTPSTYHAARLAPLRPIEEFM